MSSSHAWLSATLSLITMTTVGGFAATTTRKIHLVVNPFGGGGIGLETLDAVLPIFEAGGIEVTTLKTEYAGHAGEYARNLDLLDGFVGIGGDGTAHEIADAMLRRPEAERVPVGIIPSGSGNTWAFDLGLADAVSAAKAIVAGQLARVDVMTVAPTDAPDAREMYAINICGVGMPAAVLEQANSLRNLLGSAQYELAGLLLIVTGQTSFGATLELEAADGSTSVRELDDFSFVQAQVNMHMGKKVCFAPEADMADGLLDLVLVTKSGGLDILHANALARGATHVDTLPFVESVRCKAFTLTPRRAPEGIDLSAINLDGELESRHEATPFRAECLPAALEVFAAALNRKRMDTSDELEPQLVMGLVRMLETTR